MATKSTNPNTETDEETEPLADEEPDDFNGIPGQIVYPDVHIDAERAAAFAAGKVDNLDPDDEDGERDGWQNPADRPAEEQKEEDDE